MGVAGRSVSVGCESFLKELAGEDAGLGQVVHPLLDLDVHEAMVDQRLEVVLFDDFLGYEGDGHLHILVPIKGRVEVEVFEVDSHEFGFGGWDDTVEQYLGSGEAGGFCADVAGIINQVAADGEAGSFDFCLLGTDGDYYAAVCDSAIFWDVLAFDELDGVGAGFHAIADTEFVGKWSGPFGAGFRIFYEMAILHCVAGCGVGDGMSEMFG
jgi:hypothetical protein